jgi:hypothetical protein
MSLASMSKNVLTTCRTFDRAQPVSQISKRWMLSARTVMVSSEIIRKERRHV